VRTQSRPTIPPRAMSTMILPTSRLRRLAGLLSLLTVAALSSTASASTVGFYAEGDLGYGYANLRQFRHTNFLPEVVTLEGSGYSGSAAAGARIGFGAIGARFSHAAFEDFGVNVFAVEGEIRAPAGAVQPFVRAQVGVGWLGDLDTGDVPGALRGELDVYGWALGVGAGIDFGLGDYVTVGVGAEASLLNLTRQELSLDCTGCGDVEVGENGDALGIQVRAGLRIGLRL